VRGWLCESIIDAYLYNLCKFRNDSFFVPCLFMQMLGFGQELKGVFDNVNFFSRELIFFPANPSNAHWVLFVVRPRSQVIEYYDPMSNSCNSVMYNKLVEYINSKLIPDHPIRWTLQEPPHVKQVDDFNCGPFICFFAFALLARISLMSVDIMVFRKKIYDSIVQKCLKNKSYSTLKCVLCDKTIGGSRLQCVNCRQFCHKNCYLLNHPSMPLPDKQDFYCP